LTTSKIPGGISKNPHFFGRVIQKSRGSVSTHTKKASAREPSTVTTRLKQNRWNKERNPSVAGGEKRREKNQVLKGRVGPGENKGRKINPKPGGNKRALIGGP